MAATKIQGNVGTAASGTTVAVTLASNPTAGNMVCLAILYYSGGASGTTITGIVDGNSNAYTVTPGNSPSTYNSNAGQIFLAYRLVAPANAHATITVTFNDAIGGAAAVWAEEFNAGVGSSFTYYTDAKDTGSGTTVNTPSITPSGADSLMMCGAAVGSTVTATNSPWTASTGGAQFGCQEAYDLSVAGAQALNFTINIGSWSSMSMSFTIAAATAVTGPFPTFRPDIA